MDADDEKALECYKKQRLKAERRGNLENEARVSNYIGDIYERYGNFESAIEEHERALRIREALTRKIDVAVAFRTLGECYCKKKDYEKAHSLHENYLSLARECDDVVEQQRALTTIGNTFLEQSNERSLSLKARRCASKRAENVYQKSSEICDQLKGRIDEMEFIDMKARNFYNLGLVYDGLEDADSSKQYLNKALSLCQKHYLIDMLYVCQKALGDIYLKYNKFAEACNFLDEAYITAKKLKNKQLETDSLLLNTQGLIQMKKYSDARHLLKKAHKINRMNEEEMSKILNCYKSVVCMEKAMDSLKKMSKEEVVGRIPLYDKLGDCAVYLKMYNLAISFYNKVLTGSISMKKDNSELIPTYVSLAQTYSDCMQYEKAIVYYKKEIECYRGEENHEQVCRSWLCIAAYEEKCDIDYKKVQSSYVNAYNAAKKASNRKLQCRALTSLIEMFKVNSDEKFIKKTQDQLNHIKMKYNIVELDFEEESQITDDGDDDFGDIVNTEEELEMSDLTESEEDEEVVVSTVRMARRNGKRVKDKKRNDFGETPLHRACIKGDLQKVIQLVEEGHPINVQDNSGWIPLHEAANNNWYQITEYLLQHGAQINHRGGPKCQGMTPLIDAASVGWLDIVELLLKHGANALAKDDHQMTALDHLIKVREENGEVDRKTEIQFNTLVVMLKEKNPAYRDFLIRSLKDSEAVVTTLRSKEIMMSYVRKKWIFHELGADLKYRSCVGASRNKVLAQSKPAALVPESESYSQSLPVISHKPRNIKQRRSRNDVIMDNDSDSDDSQLQNSRLKQNSPDNSENVHPDLSDDPDDYDQSATDAYKHAISNVGRSACRSSQLVQPKLTNRTSIPDDSALIHEEEFIENDWLIDDLRPTKRHKVDINGYLSTGNIRKRSRSGSISPLPHPERHKRDSLSSQKKRIKIVESDSESETGGREQTVRSEDPRLTDISNMNSDDDDFYNTVTGGNEIDVLFNEDSDIEIISSGQTNAGKSVRSRHLFPEQKKSQKQLKLTDFGGTVTSSMSRITSNDRLQPQPVFNSAINVSQSSAVGNVTREKSLSNVIRVKVNVNGVLLLIPVVDSDGTKTFAWLADEAATRYYKLRGMKFKLTLWKDGAHFSPEDRISHVLMDNDLVESFIDSKYKQPPMTESYKTACNTLNTFCYKNVSTLLQSCEVSGKLDLSDLSLRPTHFHPVIRAVQHQMCLSELDLKGNRICDTGLENLCNVLNTVPNLVYLGLACNDITLEGLKYLCTALSAENPNILQKLTGLDLSHNPLYDRCLVSIASLIRALPQLTRLSLSSCKLTVKFFQSDRLQLTEALHSSSLQHFDVSYNLFGCVGVELFLKCQNPTRILYLDLSATIADHRSSQVYRHIYNFASQDGCSIQNLQLTQCNLSMDDSDFLIRLPVIAKQLQKLNISENPKLTNYFLQQLIQSAACETSNLEEIVANHCAVQCPLTVEFLDALTENLSASVPLRLLEFTCFKLENLDIQSLTQIWKDKFEDFGKVCCTEGRVRLTVSDR